ncbi:formylglycine-generating enzyme family protein [bacterium]
MVTVSVFLLSLLTANFKLFAQNGVTSPKMELIFVEGNSSLRDQHNDNALASNRRVDSFMMGKFEVNQDQWLWVMYTFNPSQFIGLNQPVENVTWYEAIQFCNTLSHMAELHPFYNIDGIKITRNLETTGYRLPTEAEWEYAARGGKKSHDYPYSGGDIVNEVAWYAGNSNSKSHDIGRKKPNELGIYDFCGNVWEWCWDSAGNTTTSSSIDIIKLIDKSSRMIRGSSWKCLPDSLRITHRKSFRSSESLGNLGFRICRSIQE